MSILKFLLHKNVFISTDFAALSECPGSFQRHGTTCHESECYSRCESQNALLVWEELFWATSLWERMTSTFPRPAPYPTPLLVRCEFTAGWTQSTSINICDRYSYPEPWTQRAHALCKSIDHVFYIELCWGKAMVAHTKPQQRRMKEKSERRRGEGDQIKIIDLRFEVVGPCFWNGVTAWLKSVNKLKKQRLLVSKPVQIAQETQSVRKATGNHPCHLSNLRSISLILSLYPLSCSLSSFFLCWGFV